MANPTHLEQLESKNQLQIPSENVVSDEPVAPATPRQRNWILVQLHGLVTTFTKGFRGRNKLYDVTVDTFFQESPESQDAQADGEPNDVGIAPETIGLNPVLVETLRRQKERLEQGYVEDLPEPGIMIKEGSYASTLLINGEPPKDTRELVSYLREKKIPTYIDIDKLQKIFDAGDIVNMIRLKESNLACIVFLNSILNVLILNPKIREFFGNISLREENSRDMYLERIKEKFDGGVEGFQDEFSKTELNSLGVHLALLLNASIPFVEDREGGSATALRRSERDELFKTFEKIIEGTTGKAQSLLS